MKPERVVYADHSATTPLRQEALAAMLPYLTEKYGNASGIYSIGRRSREAVERARRTTAQALGALPEEIFFTSCGTESDNWAIKGAAEAYGTQGRHIITTAVEHHAVLHTCEHLERQGFRITYLPVDAEGMVLLEALERALTPDTILVSVMMANNEVGTINPIGRIGEVLRGKGVLLHVDAVQAVGNLPIDVRKLHVDMLSVSAHKFYGPKGVGALYIRKGLKLPSYMDGGAQERGKRAGTENIPGIVSMAAALKEACDHIDENAAKVSALRDKLISGLSKIPHSALNGDPVHRLPGNVNFCFEGIEGESLLLLLDAKGICASSGSACTSGSLDPSHVLLAIGRPHEVAHGSLRLSLCEWNTEEEVSIILREVPRIVEYLRNMSPMWKDLVSGKKPFML